MTKCRDRALDRRPSTGYLPEVSDQAGVAWQVLELVNGLGSERLSESDRGRERRDKTLATQIAVWCSTGFHVRTEVDVDPNALLRSMVLERGRPTMSE